MPTVTCPAASPSIRTNRDRCQLLLLKPLPWSGQHCTPVCTHTDSLGRSYAGVRVRPGDRACLIRQRSVGSSPIGPTYTKPTPTRPDPFLSANGPDVGNRLRVRAGLVIRSRDLTTSPTEATGAAQDSSGPGLRTSCVRSSARPRIRRLGHRRHESVHVGRARAADQRRCLGRSHPPRPVRVSSARLRAFE